MGKYSRKYIGEKFITNEGYEVEVIDGGDKRLYAYIKFLYPREYIIQVKICHLKKGNIKNSYHKSVCNIGCKGEDPIIPTTKNNIKTICYVMWLNMIHRCYNENSTQYKWYGEKEVIVCEEWLCYAVFAEWFKNNYIEGYVLDKDIKQENIDNKIYSPNTCIFINKIENIIDGVNRRDNSYMTGENHHMYKNIKIYETTSITRTGFKDKCKRRGLNFNDFEEVFAEWKYRTNGNRRSKYYYFLKNKGSE